jgi:hypothetical protein
MPAAALWLYVKPACTLAAFVACVVAGARGAGFLAAAGGSVLVLAIRPVRLPLLGLAVAVPIWFVSPLAAAAVGLRIVAGAISIRLAGPGWRGGLVVVRRGRRAFTGCDRPSAAKRALRKDLRSADNSMEVLEHAFGYWIAVWATADGRRLASATRELARGLLLWDWEFQTAPNLEIRMLRMAVAETVVGLVGRLVGVCATVAVVEMLGFTQPATIIGWGVPSWVTVVPAALMAWWVSRRGPAPPITGPVLLTVVALSLYGWSGLPPLACGLALGLLAPRMSRLFENRLIGVPITPPRLPAGVGGVRTREQWKAARQALSAERHHIAHRLWSGLAADSAQTATVRAAALAACAHVDLALGILQRAVEAAETALALVRESDRVAGQVYTIAGRALLAAGDTRRAREFLDHPSVTRRHDPLVGAARAQVLALQDEPDVALNELTRSSGGLLRGGNLRRLLDSEVAVATVLADRTDFAVLEQRLLELMDLDLDNYEIVDQALREQIAVASARARLVLGRLQIRHGNPSTASEHLRRVVSTLSDPQDAFDQAIARILLGAARNLAEASRGLEELTQGVRQLESIRGQLAAGAHRNQLVNRHSETYGLALNAMERLQEHDPAGAALATELAESVRRGALATMLREPNINLAGDARAVRDQITELEARGAGAGAGGMLDHYYKRLEDELSTTFAAAYLPEAVDVDTLRVAAGNGHCLTYQLQEFSAERVRGHVIWSSPDATPVVRSIDVTDAALLAALWAADDNQRDAVMKAPQKPAELDRWQALGAELLPRELRKVLLSAVRPVSIIVVPDGQLSAFPWAALRLDDGRALLETATIQLTPSLALLDGSLRRWPGGPGSLLAYLDPGVRTTTEADALRRLGSTVVHTATALENELRGASHAGAYIAAHGLGSGLAQHVVFEDNSVMSAGRALTLAWPPLVVFASCLVARVDVELGRDPLGLPISCLLGGAQAVIGGIIPVQQAAAGAMCSEVAGRILRGIHPAEALRTVQLAELHRWRTIVPSPARWAGFACLTRIGPRPRPSRPC